MMARAKNSICYRRFTSVEFSAAQNNICRLGLNQQSEEAIDDFMNEGGISDDIASGTNPAIENYYGKYYIFLQTVSEIGLQLLALSLYDWHARRCISEKDLQEPATQEEKLNWDKNLLTDSK